MCEKVYMVNMLLVDKDDNVHACKHSVAKGLGNAIQLRKRMVKQEVKGKVEYRPCPSNYHGSDTKEVKGQTLDVYLDTSNILVCRVSITSERVYQ